ncbi:MAG: hypothetical protein GKS07_09825 [Nitrosopumilus sp.]|nr:MAG: hypothetical protein GKS07_09825 [Nitrosopumilus sp.]
MQYWNQFIGTAALANMTPVAGKEILVTCEVTVPSGADSTNFMVCICPTFGSKTGARDVYWFDQFATTIDVPFSTFILKAGEFMAIENIYNIKTLGIERLVTVDLDTT